MMIKKIATLGALVLVSGFAFAQGGTPPAVAINVVIDGTAHTVTLDSDSVWQLQRALNTSWNVHIPPNTSYRMVNGDIVGVGPGGEVFKNALRLGATSTVAEVVIVGNEIYGRSKTDATRMFRWTGTTGWQVVPAATSNATELAPQTSAGLRNNNNIRTAR